uniref:Uncharacterized protein n=1 Tax=Sinocyclocheilus grahami TaxID=75366 RepID=A0A672RG02_SINGR
MKREREKRLEGINLNYVSGNTILGREAFISRRRSGSVTPDNTVESGTVDGFPVNMTRPLLPKYLGYGQMPIKTWAPFENHCS